RTLASSSASRFAAARPMPRAAPVTRATRPLRRFGMRISRFVFPLSRWREETARRTDVRCAFLFRVNAEVLAFRQGLATVDDDRRTGDIGGFIGGEEQHGIGDVA